MQVHFENKVNDDQQYIEELRNVKIFDNFTPFELPAGYDKYDEILDSFYIKCVGCPPNSDITLGLHYVHSKPKSFDILLISYLFSHYSVLIDDHLERNPHGNFLMKFFFSLK